MGQERGGKTRVAHTRERGMAQLSFAVAKRRTRGGKRRRRVKSEEEREREREREREESVLSGEGTLEEKVAKGGNKRRSRMSGN